MKKTVKKSMDSIIFGRKLTSISSPYNIELSYLFGYLDGYFEETIYYNFISENKDILSSYSKGIKDGFRDKELIIEKHNKVNEYKEEKISWIKKLAVHDLLNNKEKRTFNGTYQVIYNKCLETPLRATGDFAFSPSDRRFINSYIKSSKIK